MLKEQVIKYLELHDLKYEDRGDKIGLQCLSPLHDDKNPSAYVDLAEGYFHCSSCSYHLNRENLIKHLGGEFNEFDFNIAEIEKSLEETPQEVKQTKVYLPKKYKDFNIKYRGISKETYEKVGAYITLNNEYYSHRVIVPMVDVYGKTRSFEAVSVKGAIPKILRPKIDIDFFGLENLIEHDEVFICEGIMNSLSFLDLGYSSVTNFGTGSTVAKIGGLIKKGVRVVWLCGDPDSINPKTNKSAGREFNKKIFYELRGLFEVRYFQYPELDVDANDLHQQGRLKEVIEYNKSKYYY